VVRRRAEPREDRGPRRQGLRRAAHLTGQDTAFGRVVSGMDVVDRIKVGDRIKAATIVRR
jgi:cyclophilin family peptidyl-prolyl cis-trans isomerase